MTACFCFAALKQLSAVWGIILRGWHVALGFVVPEFGTPLYVLDTSPGGGGGGEERRIGGGGGADPEAASNVPLLPWA